MTARQRSHQNDNNDDDDGGGGDFDDKIMSCCEPSAPEGATSAVIGRLQFAGDGMCYDQRPLTFKAGECCLPSGPSDPKWAAAYPGLRDLLLEVDALSTIDTDCCALPNPFKSKADLDEKWMPKVSKLSELSNMIRLSLGCV